MHGACTRMEQDQEAKMSQQACALEQVSDRVEMPTRFGCEDVHCLSDGYGGIHIAVLTVTDLLVESSEGTFVCMTVLLPAVQHPFPKQLSLSKRGN